LRHGSCAISFLTVPCRREWHSFSFAGFGRNHQIHLCFQNYSTLLSGGTEIALEPEAVLSKTI
jgi:hypothetical protein